jgi:tetratricopeptide (TPR) repeat protein
MLNPNLHVAYSDRGISRAMMGDMIGAINDFSKAIEVYPYFAEAYANRAIARSKMKDMDGACNDLKIALQLGFTAAKGMMQGNCK